MLSEILNLIFPDDPCIPLRTRNGIGIELHYYTTTTLVEVVSGKTYENECGRQLLQAYNWTVLFDP